MAENADKERNVELGPFFLSGVLLFAYGLVRRRALAVGLGLGAIWVDQRTELGRNVKRRIRERYLTVQVKDDGDETGGPT